MFCTRLPSHRQGWRVKALTLTWLQIKARINEWIFSGDRMAAKAMNIQYGTVCHPFGNQHSSRIFLRLERVQNSNWTKKQLGRRTNSAVASLKPDYNHV